jgi:nitrite reductase/ring-hydroxylating ferredoxin subunit
MIQNLARLPWPWRFGLGVPLLLGLILAFAVAIAWLTGSGYEPPAELEAGPAADFAIGEPKLFEEDDVWVVRLPEGEFVALYDRGVESGCPLQWRREFEFMSRRGWFVDACTGSAYDLTGRCASEACNDAVLDRFAVQIEDGNVIVELDQVLRVPAASQPPG